MIMSPRDVWTGFVQAQGDDIRFLTNDNSCTAPALVDGGFTMPNIYREGADTGYIEIIGMGAALQGEAIYYDSEHVNGVPRACDRVRQNFFAGDNPVDYGDGVARNRGVISSSETRQPVHPVGDGNNYYQDTGNVLKVSYFIRSDANGTEFGDNAVHIANFMDGPSMTNQQVGVNEGDLQGFDHPDLNGGAPTSADGGFDPVVVTTPGGAEDPAGRGAYFALRNALGAPNVVNDWSGNEAGPFSVDTDWVITTPGQYLMTNLGEYINSLEGSNPGCLSGDPDEEYVSDPDDSDAGENCDFRDIPMVATVTVYDREEAGIIVQEGDLVVSPQPPGELVEDVLDREVNVVRWSAGGVLGADKTISVPTPEGAQFGWAAVSVTPNTHERAVCDFTGSLDPTFPYELDVECVDVDDNPPLVGFAAWQRNFDDQPDANFGRIVGHSYGAQLSSAD